MFLWKMAMPFWGLAGARKGGALGFSAGFSDGWWGAHWAIKNEVERALGGPKRPWGRADGVGTLFFTIIRDLGGAVEPALYFHWPGSGCLWKGGGL